jgi:hypothetical protein
MHYQSFLSPLLNGALRLLLSRCRLHKRRKRPSVDVEPPTVFERIQQTISKALGQEVIDLTRDDDMVGFSDSIRWTLRLKLIACSLISSLRLSLYLLLAGGGRGG